MADRDGKSWTEDMNENQPHAYEPSSSGEVDPSVTLDYREAGPPFPPKQGRPPAHYLKGPREPWRSWVNAEHSGMGPIGAHRESFDHGGHK